MEQDQVKVYTIYAGINGAGKSTIYETKKRPNENRVNSDEILVANGGDWRNMKDQTRAGMEALRRIDYFINNGLSFNQETTLAGRFLFGKIKKAKEQDFEIKLFYIGVESADLAIERVKNRVQKGGHGIEEATIRKRYGVSLSMLKEVLPLCDIAVIYDNTKQYAMIAGFHDGNCTLYSRNCEWFNRTMPEVLKME